MFLFFFCSYCVDEIPFFSNIFCRGAVCYSAAVVLDTSCFLTGNIREDMEDRQVTRIFMVRHGQTDWNTEHRLQGHRDIDLNEVGCHQVLLWGHYALSISALSLLVLSNLVICLDYFSFYL